MSTKDLETIITDYASHAAEIRHIRDEVFLKEQKISREDEYDDRDAECVFALAYLNGQAVGTGRLDLPKDGKLGRVAVLPAFRREGVGRAIMKTFEVFAATQSDLDRIWFHAQKAAVPFYVELGYQIVGEEFWEAGIPHVFMEKPIRRVT